jgi:hypothetical protein
VPESLRLTLSSQVPVASDQMLGLAPEPEQTRGQSYTWNWDTKRAPDVWAAFMAPAWWRNFEAARSAAAGPEAGPAQHLALSKMYQELAALPRLPFAPAADFYTRYYPLAIAELQAATTPGSAGPAPTPEQVTAHALLAKLYHDQADRMGRDAGDVYLDLAASEAGAAIAGGASDPALRTLAADALVRLASIANARGDSARAEAYLAKRAELEPAPGTGAAAEQKTARLALAENEVRQGNLASAQRIISDTFGAESIDILALRAPLAGQALVTVETTLEVPPGDPRPQGAAGLAGKRKVTESLVDGRNPKALAALIGQAAEAWGSVRGVTVESGPDWVSVEYAFSDESQLADIQARISRMLPNIPELALMSAALAPGALALEAGQTDFQNAWRYNEAVDLAPAADAWQRRADEVRFAGVRLAPPPPDAVALDPNPESGQNEPAASGVTTGTLGTRMDLGDLQRAIWNANAAGWEKLAEHSYAQYVVHLGESGPSRQWQVQAGMQRTLEAETVGWRADRLALAAGAAGLAALLIAVLLWRLL